MQKTILYFLLGTLSGYFINYFLYNSEHKGLDLFYAVGFGLGWAMAYYLDTPQYKLPIKMLISFVAMFLMVAVGSFIFDLQLAIPSLFHFATVFVAYYMIASMKDSKSLRN